RNRNVLPSAAGTSLRSPEALRAAHEVLSPRSSKLDCSRAECAASLDPARPPSSAKKISRGGAAKRQISGYAESRFVSTILLAPRRCAVTRNFFFGLARRALRATRTSPYTRLTLRLHSLAPVPAPRHRVLRI